MSPFGDMLSHFNTKHNTDRQTNEIASHNVYKCKKTSVLKQRVRLIVHHHMYKTAKI